MKQNGGGRRSSKRSKIELYASVLEVIKRYPEGARVTKMSYGVGVPIDRLKQILNDLNSFGLIQVITDVEDGDGAKKKKYYNGNSEGDAAVFYLLTPRAFEFLETYWKMRSFLEVFGSDIQNELY